LLLVWPAARGAAGCRGGVGRGGGLAGWLPRGSQAQRGCRRWRRGRWGRAGSLAALGCRAARPGRRRPTARAENKPLQTRWAARVCGGPWSHARAPGAHTGAKPSVCQPAGAGFAGAGDARPSSAVVARSAGHACRASGPRPGGVGGSGAAAGWPPAVYQNPATIHESKSQHQSCTATRVGCRVLSGIPHPGGNHRAANGASGAFRGHDGDETAGPAAPRSKPPSEVTDGFLFEERWPNRVLEGACCGTNSLYSSLFCAPSVFVTGWPLHGASLALAANKPKSSPTGQRVGLLPSNGATCWRVYLCEASYVCPGQSHFSTQRYVLIAVVGPAIRGTAIAQSASRTTTGGAVHVTRVPFPQGCVPPTPPPLPSHEKGTRARIAATWPPCLHRWVLPV
jgi:hypothetical protein